jgi:hypothetical protein
VKVLTRIFFIFSQIIKSNLLVAQLPFKELLLFTLQAFEAVENIFTDSLRALELALNSSIERVLRGF